ncbi:MAG: hypothetical protein NW226_20110 [Microscillaceae bacterium]|nr:hypothetical protein [Microscillaceae bacterium]
MTMTPNQQTSKKRKFYPGDIRQAGTKEFSMILGNLINYKHQLVREENEQKIGDLMLKIATKLKELGYKAASEAIKKKVGRRKSGKFSGITPKKKQDTIDIAVKCWEEASLINESAKEKPRGVRNNQFI